MPRTRNTAPRHPGVPMMERLQEALRMRDAANHIFNGIMSGCIQMSTAAGAAWRDLVDQFCRDNGDLVSRERCAAARADHDSFFRLIEWVIACREESLKQHDGGAAAPELSNESTRFHRGGRI